MKRNLIASLFFAASALTSMAGAYDSATNALITQVLGEAPAVAALSGFREMVSAAEWDLVGVDGEAFAILPYDRCWVFQLDSEPFGECFIRERPIVVLSEDLTDWEIYKSVMPAVLRRIADGKQRGFEELNDDAVPRIIAPTVTAKPKLLANALTSTPSSDSNPHLYALLIAGGNKPPSNGIRFYEDITNAYTTLHKVCGVPKANIFAYSASGDKNSADYNTSMSSTAVYTTVPFDIDGDSVDEIRGGANEGFDVCITNLAAQLTAEDRLLVFVSSHGGILDSNQRTMDSALFLWGRYEWDCNYAAKFDDFACPVAFIQEHCYSGGFADDLAERAGRVILTAANPYELSWGGEHFNFLPYCFNYGVEKAKIMNFYDAAVFAIENDAGYFGSIEHPMYVETTPKLGYEFRFDNQTTPATTYVKYTFDARGGLCLTTNFWYRNDNSIDWLPSALSDNGFHEGWKWVSYPERQVAAYYTPFTTNESQLALSGYKGTAAAVVSNACSKLWTWTAPLDGEVVFSIAGSYGTGTLAIYNGATKVTSYTPVEPEWPTVNFTAQKGVTYTVKVSNDTYGSVATFRLGWDMGKQPLMMLLSAK